MKIIFFLIVLSLITATGFLLAFFWAVKSGQYEDDITPSMRLMIEEDMIEKIESKPNSK
ncbi:MAG: cbb3-type cytochrome oxidase assembly protein CcoS [Saprospiraceae bacterium]|nr:cbb3-type cytochrome oxidase assembly protein CcoS [Saprospiraceae bacterium]MBK8634298.1 cbb3-type cytochrome oxidase assembly protein CcoS [Saprospiraceae bacterium]MBP7642826.1 cbb3-type cytochrome oxidase assembly protein CcoS [Saprospiraceae bacterium]